MLAHCDCIVRVLLALWEVLALMHVPLQMIDIFFMLNIGLDIFLTLKETSLETAHSYTAYRFWEKNVMWPNSSNIGKI